MADGKQKNSFSADMDHNSGTHVRTLPWGMNSLQMWKHLQANLPKSNPDIARICGGALLHKVLTLKERLA